MYLALPGTEQRLQTRSYKLHSTHRCIWFGLKVVFKTLELFADIFKKQVMSHKSPDFQPLLENSVAKVVVSPLLMDSNWSQSPPSMPVIRWQEEWGRCSYLLSVKWKGVCLYQKINCEDQIFQKKKKRESISLWKKKNILRSWMCKQRVLDQKNI